MTKPIQPELSAWFAGCGAARNRVFCAVFLCAWVLLGAADWGLRFRHFRWQDVWWIRGTGAGDAAAAAEGARPPDIIQPARRGGDLTSFFPFRFLAAPYEEFHPQAVWPCDENGLRNEWPSGNGHYGAMFTGDSFMVSLGTQNIAQVFAETSGLETCNFGRRASGPMQQIGWFIQCRPLRELPPLAFWGLTARDLEGELFARQPLEAWFAGKTAESERRDEIPRRGRIRWEMLRPRELDRAWPNTSALAYFARHAWGAVRMVAFRKWPAEIAAAEHPAFGPMLFYGENLRVLPELTPEKDAAGILQTVGRISDWFEQHGTALVVLLIPEKEQIHEDLLPPEQRRGIENGADALVSALAEGLAAQGVHAVNLLPAFRQGAAEGTCLYWRDDTHWNDAGIHLAAREAWKYVLEHRLADGGPERSAGSGAE